MVLACIDVFYSERESSAACVIFDSWDATAPSQTVVRRSPIAAAYEPGAFYRRELPPILDLIRELADVPDIVIIDGYVRLGVDRPGLGAHLYDALDRRSAIVGVAKKSFKDAPAIEVRRGGSERPLYVTAAGMSAEEAAQHIAQMSGPFRIPTLIKLADQLSRSI